MIPVILSGGTGSRLWPLSRTTHPKQFLPLTHKKSLFQLTLERLAGANNVGAPVVVCNEQHRFLAAEQLRSIDRHSAMILLEPVGRNTAPAIAVAALAVAAQDAGGVMVVLPADHLMLEEASFHQSLQVARAAAESGALVTFGIRPTRPETGYGYIKRGSPVALDGIGGSSLFRVDRFVEKPNGSAARDYFASGDYLWNSGMFLFTARTLLEELERFAPDIARSASEAYRLARYDLDFVRLNPVAFAACRGESIDYAVMEKTENGLVVPLNAGWSDLGSWSALHEVAVADEAGNVLLGDVVAEDTHHSYIRSEGRLVATIGLTHHVVVETADAVLVAHGDRLQEVKAIVERLKVDGREETDFHRRVFRPWGWYEGIARAERFQVKRIQVHPGASLSLQMHHHRAEHWVVVHGTARVTCGDEVRLLGEDQSTYIPLGVSHRLENPGVIPLEVIEVQTGSYLGEEDIVRYEDRYGRDEPQSTGS